MALELILTADTLASLKVQVAAWHNQLNGDSGYSGQKSYEIGSGEAIEEKPKAAKAKAEKPKADVEKPVDAYTEALKEPAKEVAPLDYQKDVVAKILAKVAGLQDAGLDPAAAKAKVQDVIKTTFGVTNAKEVPADKWPTLLDAVAKVSANG